MNTVKIQGFTFVSPNGHYELTATINGNQQWMFIKNWVKTNNVPHTNTANADQWRNNFQVSGQNNAYTWAGNAIYTQWFIKPDNCLGVNGPNNTRPACLFSQHQIVLIGTTYYDPCYCATHTDLQDYTALIDGYADLLSSRPKGEYSTLTITVPDHNSVIMQPRYIP